MDDLEALNFWLESILLSEYFDTFVSSGLTTQESCAGLDDAVLTNIGVSLQGHRRRILNHLPIPGSGRWIHSPTGPAMEEAVPTIPPKTKSFRDSYLFQGDIYQNLEALGATGESSSHESHTPSPRPVPRPRARSNVKTSPSSGDPTPQPMKKPTPAPRRTRPSDSAVPDATSVSKPDTKTGSHAANVDQSAGSLTHLSGSVKVLGACTSETSTDSVSDMPPPCVETDDSSSAAYNLFGATPDRHSTDHSPNQDTNQTTQGKTQTSETTQNDQGKTVENFSNDFQPVGTEDSLEYTTVYKGNNQITKQESFENVRFDTSLNKYVLPADAMRDFDPITVTSSREPQIPEGGATVEASEGDLYEPIWAPPKRLNSAVNTQVNRSSNLMEFSPLPKKGFSFPTKDSQVQTRGAKNRESFNMPPPSFAPPPLPASAAPSEEEISDFDPLTRAPSMPPVPPRPSHYVKSGIFKPYENVPFITSGESVTLPQAVNMEPDAIISPQPIGFTNSGASMSMDPFQNKDPFGEFTPDTEGFDDHIPAKPPPPRPPMAEAIYDVAEEVLPTAGAEGAIYEMANEPEDFDPFGLRSTQPLPRTMSSTSSSSGTSHNLDVVPPAPSWAQKVPVPSHVGGSPDVTTVEEGDDSSEGSVEDFLDPKPDSDEPAMSPVDILPPTALSPRKRERSGYLYKQGGIKQNKGWKKRWVIFDGKSLRYYANSKTQVSKRIVPLSCMKNVAMDVKARPLSRIINSGDLFPNSNRRSTRKSSDSSLTPNNSRQFKFKLECTNRVFLFATDSLDDCKMWSSTMMEAIIKYKKPDGGEVAGGEMADPDIEGWIKFNRNRLKFYVVLKNHTLCYYQSKDDFNMASPLHEIDMKLSAIKELERTKLRLSTHYCQFILMFESSSEASNWKMAIEEAITDALGDNTILDQVKENPDNINCADCGAPESHWASMNLGIVLCVKCAGVHRGFDYKLSKIRSLRMDTKVWNSSLIEMFKVIGNRNANSFWACNQISDQKIDAGVQPQVRKDYIMEKYRDRQFCNIHALSSDQTALNEALLEAAKTDDVLLTMQILFSGADVLYTRPGEPNSTAYELAKDARQRIQMEFLLQNGGDKTQNFMPGSEEASLIAKLRAQVQFQGYLQKTGSNMKDFLRRWVVLEHGHIGYYDSEESKVENDRIDNDAILCMQTVATERHPFCFEISTKKGNNRVYLFCAISEEERLQWLRYIAQIFCPVNLMDQMKQKEFSFVGYAYMKTGFNKEWQRTWYVLEQRKLFFTDKEQQERDEDSLDLRKVTNISKITDRGMDSCDTCLEQGPHFVLNAPGRALYLQADLNRDTERMYTILEQAIKKGGDVLEDQPLDSSEVPVIISQCVHFIYTHGNKMKGIYREAAQDSRIKALLERFREDSRSVVLKMEDHTVHEVCNVLKRFLRNLSDPLLTQHLYKRWIQTAAESDHNVKLQWYRYLLQQLPRVNYKTLLCLANHLHKLSEHAGENLMTLDNISIAFGSTLMKSSAEGAVINPNSIGNAMQLEMKVISDIITYYTWLFDIDESDARQMTIENQIQMAVDKMKVIEQQRNSISQPDHLMTPVYFMDTKGKEETVMVNKQTTASDVIRSLMSRLKLSTSIWCLHEVVRGELERPLHSQTKIWPLITEWQNWASDYSASARLVLKNNKLKESIEKAYDPCKPLFGEMKYAEKKKFAKMAFEFTHAKLSCYKDIKSLNNAIGCWNIEDLSVYRGSDTSHKRDKPPTKWSFSFISKGDKVGEKELPYFGRAVCCNSEDELMSWLGGMMMAQHPSGFS